MAAADIIRGAGLERYYAEREAFPARPTPLDGAWTALTTEPQADGTVAARLIIDGLRCASCVWLTEQVLARMPGVAEATVSYASGRALLRWDPARTTLAALAGRIAALGYQPRPLGVEPHTDRTLLLRLGLAAIAAVAVMGLYEGLYAGWWYGAIDARMATLFRWVSLALATPVAFWCAAPFFAGATAGLRQRVLSMDLPIALGIIVLWVHGLASTLQNRDGYLDSLTMLVALLLVGRVLEARGRRRAADAATALVATVPRTARRSTPLGIERVPTELLRVGDTIDVGSGEEFAADGIVTEGTGQVRMSLITGEAEPVPVAPGDQVVAGSVLLDGALTVEVRATGGETVLQRMADELQRAADTGVRASGVDRIAPWFTVVTLVVAGITFAGWLAFRGLDAAVASTVAVLVVACPCALALAQPLAGAAGLGAAARRGLLFRSTQALLDLNDITVIALDKTGTVTAGEMTVVAADDAALRIAAGLERFSSHPIARAIVAEATRREIPLPRATGVHELAGVGVQGDLDGRRWSLTTGGAGSVCLQDGTAARSFIRLGDALRADAAGTVAALHATGRRVLLLTGDHGRIAEQVATGTGIREIISEADPRTKSSVILRLQQEGERVLFAGDGINDGLALSVADVGVAMGSGAASSVLIADAVISSAALAPLLAGFRAARAAGDAIRINLRFSLGYNVVAILAAAAGLVNPLVAAILMPLSSAVVIWGAARVETRVRREEMA